MPTVIFGKVLVSDGEAGVAKASGEQAPKYAWQIIAEFRSFCKPVIHDLTPFATKLTGITSDDIEKDGHKSFEQVYKDWHSFMGKFPNSLLVTCGDWDLRIMLQKALKQLSGQGITDYHRGPKYWCNVKHCFEEFYGKKAGGWRAC